MKKLEKKKLHVGREVVKSLTELEAPQLRDVAGAFPARTNAGTCGSSRIAFMCQSDNPWCQIVTD